MDGEYWERGHFNKNPSQFVPVPANALDMHTVLVNKIDELEEYVGTDEYIEDIAKEKLGLVYPNEILFEAE